ncbi:MAG: hypothetical protein V9H26_06830 [Verrucomicrobiota bacterium]
MRATSCSYDLVTWTKLMARTSSGVMTNYTDLRATNYTSRFYRLPSAVTDDSSSGWKEAGWFWW